MVHVKAKIRIRQSPAACYRRWRRFQDLPQILSHVQSVTIQDDHHSHWVVAAPGDTSEEWDAEITEDIPNERISWRSLEGAQVDNTGKVQFVPKGDHQTEVRVSLTYKPPMGEIGNFVGRLFGEFPEDELSDDLVRFKNSMEGSN